MWQITFQFQFTDLNIHTLILNGTTIKESLNSLYTVLSSASVLEKIKLFNNDPKQQEAKEAIHNVYKHPIIERAFQYLHATVGFPTKATWIKSIHNGNYPTWTLITVKNVNKHFP